MRGARPARLAPLLLLTLCGAVLAQSGGSETEVELSGHLKTRFLGAAFGDESLFHDLVGGDAKDANFDLRLNLAGRVGKWDGQADGQLIGLYGDTLEATRPLREELPLFGAGLADDSRRRGPASVRSDGGAAVSARSGTSGVDADSSSSDRVITRLAWDPSDRQYQDDPADYYRWLRDEEPLHYHAASGSYFLSRFDDVWNATADWRTFSSKSPVAKLRHMASMDGPDHDRLRAQVARHFAPRRIAALEPSIRAVCRTLLDPLVEQPRFDLVEAFTTRFPSRVIHRLMGVPDSLDAPIRAVALGIGAARDTETLGRLMGELHALTCRVVEGDPPPEVPGLIQQLQRDVGHDLSFAELCGVCSNLVLAGTDTVTNLVGNGVVLLARRPALRDRLAAAPSELPDAIEEILRFESPVQSLARRTTRPVALHGAEIPAGAEIRLQWGAANRDDREFERPDHFDPSRRIRRHLALGHGAHYCLGAGLARLEARVAFEEILARWPSLPVDWSRLSRLPSLWVRAWEGIEFTRDA